MEEVNIKDGNVKNDQSKSLDDSELDENPTFNNNTEAFSDSKIPFS